MTLRDFGVVDLARRVTMGAMNALAESPARVADRPRRDEPEHAADILSAFARTRAAYEELGRPRPIRTPAQEPSRKRTNPPITTR